MPDRSYEDATVHAILPDGRRVIRRDLKWFVEDVAAGTLTPVNADEAAAIAMEGAVRFGVYGGIKFDAKVRRLLAARQEN